MTEKNYQRRNDKRNGERAQQQAHDVGQIATSERLRGHSTRTHTQKAEYPIYHIEYHRTDSYRTYIHGIAHVPHYGHIDKSEQGHGDV